MPLRPGAQGAGSSLSDADGQLDGGWGTLLAGADLCRAVSDLESLLMREVEAEVLTLPRVLGTLGFQRIVPLLAAANASIFSPSTCLESFCKVRRREDGRACFVGWLGFPEIAVVTYDRAPPFFLRLRQACEGLPAGAGAGPWR